MCRSLADEVATQILMLIRLNATNQSKKPDRDDLAFFLAFTNYYLAHPTDCGSP